MAKNTGQSYSLSVTFARSCFNRNLLLDFRPSSNTDLIRSFGSSVPRFAVTRFLFRADVAFIDSYERSHFSAYDLLTRIPRGVSHDTSSQLMSSSLAVVALKVMKVVLVRLDNEA